VTAELIDAMPQPLIVWFRQDLRLADNPALLAAVASGAPVVPLYVLDDDTAGAWRLGGASRWWLHESLRALAADLAARGASLVLRRGPADRVVAAVVAEIGAGAVHWNRSYDPLAIDRDTRIKADLRERNIAAESHDAALLFEPWRIATGGGAPYRVFTPFHKACLAVGEPTPPGVAPSRLLGMAGIASDRLDDWALTPSKPDWTGGLRSAWTPGEAGAAARVTRFLRDGMADYASRRDLPGVPGTARISPHLHFGEIGPRQVWQAVTMAAAGDPRRKAGAAAFLRELVWREFSHHLLFHFPHLPERCFRPEFEEFPWAPDGTRLRAWQRGLTGYPLVDAGMRELWTTGWMHNRVRMVAASFLVKHLLQPWQDGAAWFWDTLVDADLANNAASWQWVAGCGADAAPYFRIFNPTLQGQKFDPDGTYTRRWVPELSRLPDRYLQAPWTAPGAVLAKAGVELGRTYPKPIVEHDAARRAALAAYRTIVGEQRLSA